MKKRCVYWWNKRKVVYERLQKLWPFIFIVLGLPFVALRYKHHRSFIDPAKVRRILIVRPDHIGDVIMTTPLFDMLKKVFPDAKIDVLLGPWSVELFSHDTRVENILSFAAPWHDHATRPKNPLYVLKESTKLFQTLRKNKYDIAIDPRGHLLDSWVAYKSGARIVAGTVIDSVGSFYNPMMLSNASFLTHQALYGNKLHLVKNQLQVLMQVICGHTVPQTSTSVSIPPKEDMLVQSFLNHSPVTAIKVSVHIDSRDTNRQWPMENFVTIINTLFDTYGKKLSIFLIGSDAEKSERMREMVRKEKREMVINTSGQCTLLQTATLMSKMTVHVGNDSGPMHLANAVGTPIVGIFIKIFALVHAPTDHQDNEIITTNDDTSTISAISVDRVFDATCRVIDKHILLKNTAPAI